MGLRVDGITKSFGGNVAVDHITFSMDAPGVFGLIGTNGAGKTTTIRCVLGIMTPDSGEASWDGGKIERESRLFGYMPEERGIYMKTKVLEQLVYFGQLRGMSARDAKRSAKAYMERLGVSQYADMTAEKLSKGNQQKVQLIATLLHDPRLIFLDEPFSGLDPVNVELLRSLIAELVGEGRCIVLSSHQMNVVEEYCENLCVLHKGKTVLSGNLSRIKAGYGRTNLVLSAPKEADAIADACGLQLLSKRADEAEYRIGGDDMARAFLKRLVEAGLYPDRYVIREPSLNEIFIEKVGESE